MKKMLSRFLTVVVASFTVLVMTCTPVLAAGNITETQAKKIALKDAGLKEKAVIFLKIELDEGKMEDTEVASEDASSDESASEDAKSDESRTDTGSAPKYEIEFYHDGTEYEYEIDAKTGEILKVSKDTEFFLNPGALPTTLP